MFDKRIWTDTCLQEVIFTENTAPDREIWDEKGGLIKKGAAEIAERDQETDEEGWEEMTEHLRERWVDRTKIQETIWKRMENQDKALIY